MQNTVFWKESATYWRSLCGAILVLTGYLLPAGAQTPPPQCTATIQWNSTGFPLTQADANVCWPTDTSYHVATEMYNIIKTSGCATTLVQNARAASAFPSTLSSTTLNTNLANLLTWMVKDMMYACINTQNTIHLSLPTSDPTGSNANGATNSQLTVLSNTYWLADNAIYASAALKQYTTYIGTQLSNDYTAAWGATLPNGVANYTANLCNENVSQYPAGVLPLYDTPSGGSGPLCNWITAPTVWNALLPVQQYPDPANTCFANLTGPVVGADSQVLTASVSGCQTIPSGAAQTTSTAAIATNATRNLLKYGCLRQVLKGNTTDATTMFQDAIATWDGGGLTDPGTVTGQYNVRNLEFALMCANALGINNNNNYTGGSVNLPKATVENQIWGLQQTTSVHSNTQMTTIGGIWTGYCTSAYSGDGACNLNPLIDGIGVLDQWGLTGAEKETEEDAPLVLLAYGKNIW